MKWIDCTICDTMAGFYQANKVLRWLDAYQFKRSLNRLETYQRLGVGALLDNWIDKDGDEVELEQYRKHLESENCMANLLHCVAGGAVRQGGEGGLCKIKG